MENDNIDGAMNVIRNANNHQYSQNTYMGLSNG